MKVHDMVIHETDAEKINAVLNTFLGESGASEALLIDRSGQLLSMTGANRALDTVSISALAAGAFSSTGALAQLLGSRIPGGSAMGGILLAIFGERTTVGMVRLFAKEAATAVGQILAEARSKPKTTGALSTPLTADESRTSFGEKTR